jgi:hypothetical protein
MHALQEITQPRDLDNAFVGQHGCDYLSLRSGMYLIQAALTRRLGHELPDAVVQRAIDDQIWPGAISDANALIPDGGPFSQNGRSLEIDMTVRMGHYRASFIFISKLLVTFPAIF